MPIRLNRRAPGRWFLAVIRTGSDELHAERPHWCVPCITSAVTEYVCALSSGTREHAQLLVVAKFGDVVFTLRTMHTYIRINKHACEDAYMHP